MTIREEVFERLRQQGDDRTDIFDNLPSALQAMLLEAERRADDTGQRDGTEYYGHFILDEPPKNGFKPSQS